MISPPESLVWGRFKQHCEYNILNNLEESEKELKIIEKLGKEFNWYANLTRLRFLS
jgi:hypothetical protein